MAPRQAKARYILLFGDREPGEDQQDRWQPLTVGVYPSRAAALAVIRGDEESEWHEDKDYTMLYEGAPGGNLKFIGEGRDVLAYLNLKGDTDGEA